MKPKPLDMSPKPKNKSPKPAPRLSKIKYTQTRSKQSRRTRIPDSLGKPANFWSIAKNSIGKDLTKISMPVNFAEPLSFLQRLTEDFDYAELLDKAANAENDALQVAYVAAFAISSYSNTVDRVNKPFNPLLGETYECDRTDDLGWKSIAEQVSHHPPISAIHCIGKNWTVWQQFTMDSKFRGKFIRVIPIGICHLEFSEKNHYTWNKVETTVYNVILGNLWIDHSGTMTINNHTTGWKSTIEFIPYNYYSKDEQRGIKGTITDDKGVVKSILSGKWNDKLKVSSVLETSGKPDKPIYKTDIGEVIWQRRPLDPEAKRYYYFSLLACQLNEMEPNVAPTDSRLRPDQRLMEEGNWDQANVLKTMLEEYHRKKRREGTEPKPLWFDLKQDPITKQPIHLYNGNYWQCKEKQNWSKCPNLFNIAE